MSRALLALVSLTALFAFATLASAQVAIEPRIEPGRELAYELGFELERGLVLGAGRDRLVQGAGVRLVVESVDEEGVATVRGAFDWVLIDLDRASFRVRVDSRDLVGDSPNLAETTIREMVAAYLADEFTLRVSPEGRVLETSGLEGVTTKLEASQGSLRRLAAGRFLPETLGQDLEPIWSADGAAGTRLAEGDEWSVAREQALGAGVSMTMTTDWTATEIEDRAVTLDGAVVARIELPETEGELPMTFELTEQTGDSSAVWDAEVGAMRSREASLSYTITVSVGEQAQTSQRTGRSTLELLSASTAPPASE